MWWFMSPMFDDMVQDFEWFWYFQFLKYHWSPFGPFSMFFFWFSFGTNVSNVAEWPWLPAQWLDQWGARHLWAIGEKPYTPMISVAMFHYQSAWIAVSETIEENVVCEVKGSVTRPNKKVFGCSCWCFNPACDNVAQQKNNHWIYIYIHLCG